MFFLSIWTRLRHQHITISRQKEKSAPGSGGANPPRLDEGRRMATKQTLATPDHPQCKGSGRSGIRHNDDVRYYPYDCP